MNKFVASIASRDWDWSNDSEWGENVCGLSAFISETQCFDLITELIDLNTDIGLISAAWISSDLGYLPSSVFNRVKFLLNSEINKVRFEMVEVYSLCALTGEDLFRLHEMTKDDNDAVKRRACSAIAQLSEMQKESLKKFLKNEKRE